MSTALVKQGPTIVRVRRIMAKPPGVDMKAVRARRFNAKCACDSAAKGTLGDYFDPVASMGGGFEGVHAFPELGSWFSSLLGTATKVAGSLIGGGGGGSSQPVVVNAPAPAPSPAPSPTPSPSPDATGILDFFGNVLSNVPDIIRAVKGQPAATTVRTPVGTVSIPGAGNVPGYGQPAYVNQQQPAAVTNVQPAAPQWIKGVDNSLVIIGAGLLAVAVISRK